MTINIKPVLQYLFIFLLPTLWPLTTSAIYIGNLTFSIPENEIFVAKNVLNNNKSARIYQVDIIAIDSPGEHETQTHPADGELLYAPKSLALSAGNSDFFKFYYHGPQDDKERYYRASFREIPAENHQVSLPQGGTVGMEPVVIMDAILVVRPRNSQFKWALNKQESSLTNSGNTYFKLILKPGCESTEEDGNTYYLRPGDTLHDPMLQQPGEKYIVYNDNFISLTDECLK